MSSIGFVGTSRCCSIAGHHSPGQPIPLGHPGYELSREDHILALQSDQDLITQALRSLAKQRPQRKGGGNGATETVIETKLQIQTMEFSRGILLG